MRVLVLLVAGPAAAFSQPTLQSPVDEQRQPDIEAKRVLEIARADDGLHSLEEAPRFLQLSVSAEAMGYLVTAWALERELVALARRNPSDLRTVPILDGIAEARWSRRRDPAYLEWVCRIASAAGPCSGQRRQAASAYVQLEALNLWSDAIRVLVDNRLYSSPDLERLERKLINHGGCDMVAGQSYTRLITYKALNAEPPLAQAMALVQAADSDFVCSSEAQAARQSSRTRSARRRSALEAYQKAYELLELVNTEPADIDAIFAPEIPIMLTPFPPASAYPMPQAVNASTAGTYIDVAFEITKDGGARKVEILDTTTSTSGGARQDLVAWIEGGLFRPRMRDGRIADSARVVWRYYW